MEPRLSAARLVTGQNDSRLSAGFRTPAERLRLALALPSRRSGVVRQMPQRSAIRSVWSAARSARARRTAGCRAIPAASGRVTASRQTHSPAGSRFRWTLRSTLMNRYRPVERHADAVTRVRGDQHPLQRRRLLVRDQRQAYPHPDGRRARLGKVAVHEPVLHRGVVADLLAGVEERLSVACSAPGRAGAAARGRPGVQAGSRRSRQAHARIKGSPDSSRRTVVTNSTERPGRTTSASTRSRAIGTGRRIS